MVRVKGEPGTGKTWISLDVTRRWIESGGAVLAAEGDFAFAQRPLAALSFALSDSRTVASGSIRKTSRASLSLAEKLLTPVGPATALFDLLVSAIDQRFERATRPLSGTEREIIVDICRDARRKPLLIVADNAHWWDTASLCLLEYMRSRKVCALLPELQRVSVLLLDTYEQQGAIDEEVFGRLVAESATPPFELRRARRSEFESTLHMLGLSRPVPERTLDMLFHATGAHLKLCEQLVDFLQQDTPADLGGFESSDLLRRTLDHRLASLGRDSAALAEMLKAAAPIGLRFDAAHLSCVVKRSITDVHRLLALAEGASLIAVSGSSASFTHDLLRTHFLTSGTADEVRQRYGQLAECLKILRPGEYGTRASFLTQASRQEEARDLSAVAIVRRAREGASSAAIENAIDASLRDEMETAAIVREVARIYKLATSGNHKDALRACAVLSSRGGGLLAAECAYVEALVWTEQQTLDGFKKSRSILEHWRPRLEDEAELWMRFGLLLQQALVLADDLDRARDVEHELQAALGERAAFDAAAVKLMHVQNRRSAGLYGSAFAELKINRAVEFFERKAAQGGTGWVIELYKALTNHCAVLITLNRNRDAIVSARRAVALILDNPEISFPRKDVLAHDLAMALLRSGDAGIEEAVSLQRQIIESLDPGDDSFLQRCSLGTMYLLAGQIKAARGVADELMREIASDAIGESFLLYYSATLNEAISIHEREWDQARACLDRSWTIIRDVNWTSAAYVKERHKLLRELVDSRSPVPTGADFDEFLIKRAPLQIGDEWQHYGRLASLCELSFWVDN